MLKYVVATLNQHTFCNYSMETKRKIVFQITPNLPACKSNTQLQSIDLNMYLNPRSKIHSKQP